MSNISKAFEHGKAFIPFVTCGDPSLDVTEEVVYAMVEAGADIIELGIPGRKYKSAGRRRHDRQGI